MDLEKENNKKKRMLAGVGGGMLAASLGLAAGPLGPIAVAMLSGGSAPVFAEILEDVLGRSLSPREKSRIETVEHFATQKYNEKLSAHETLRSDDFFLDNLDDRAASKEIAEAVLLVARDEYQERKLKFFGYLLINIAFDPNVNRAQANHLIKLSEIISYTQMCILSIFANHEKFDLRNRIFGSSAFPFQDAKKNSLFQEAFDLGSRGLLWRGIQGSTYQNIRAEPVTMASDFSIPDMVGVAGIGHDLYRLMELWRIEETELDSIIFELFDSHYESDIRL